MDSNLKRKLQEILPVECCAYIIGRADNDRPFPWPVSFWMRWRGIGPARMNKLAELGLVMKPDVRIFTLTDRRRVRFAKHGEGRAKRYTVAILPVAA